MTHYRRKRGFRLIVSEGKIPSWQGGMVAKAGNWQNSSSTVNKKQRVQTLVKDKAIWSQSRPSDILSPARLLLLNLPPLLGPSVQMLSQWGCILIQTTQGALIQTIGTKRWLTIRTQMSMPKHVKQILVGSNRLHYLNSWRSMMDKAAQQKMT